MNEAPQLISIQMIKSNPYQLRQAEDPIAVAELAENIERNTLLQPPMVRQVLLSPSHQKLEYELAFGHTRLAAFKLLESQGKAEYKYMPCFVRELDDLQMFEMAVAENIKRRDLNPIERARAMNTYIKQFNKTSAETGEFFNCDEATVRGTVRLLGLPERARESLAKGEITIGTARSLLTLQRIVSKEKVEDVNDRIVNDGNAEIEVNSALKGEKNCQVLQESYVRREQPTAGDGLWKLDMEPAKFPALPKLTSAQAQVAGVIGKEGGKRKAELKEWIEHLESGLVAGEALIAQGVPAEAVEKLEHLVHPPACAQCAYYVQANQTHFCGWKACWKRKGEAWIKVEAERLSKKLEIPIYNAEKDGDYIELDYSWNEDQKKKFTDRIPGLRLLPTSENRYGTYAFTNSHRIKLVDITPENVLGEKEREKNQAGQRERENLDRENERARLQLSNQFIEHIAIPIFAAVLEPIKNENVLMALMKQTYGSFRPDAEELLNDEEGHERGEEERKQLIRCAIVNEMIDLDYSLKLQGPEKLAGILQELAADWELTLPTDWMEKIRSFTARKGDSEVDE